MKTTIKILFFSLLSVLIHSCVPVPDDVDENTVVYKYEVDSITIQAESVISNSLYLGGMSTRYLNYPINIIGNETEVLLDQYQGSFMYFNKATFIDDYINKYIVNVTYNDNTYYRRDTLTFNRTNNLINSMNNSIVNSNNNQDTSAQITRIFVYNPSTQLLNINSPINSFFPSNTTAEYMINGYSFTYNNSVSNDLSNSRFDISNLIYSMLLNYFQIGNSAHYYSEFQLQKAMLYLNKKITKPSFYLPTEIFYRIGNPVQNIKACSITYKKDAEFNNRIKEIVFDFSNTYFGGSYTKLIYQIHYKP